MWYDPVFKVFTVKGEEVGGSGGASDVPRRTDELMPITVVPVRRVQVNRFKQTTSFSLVVVLWL